ncbi:MAG: hypothetical protein ABI612_26435, partial [Betaproteobacteria bacterium]
RLLCFVKSPQLDVRRRIRAARTLAIVADDELDEGLAKVVNEINLDLRPPDIASTLMHGQTHVIYNSIFGDRAEALMSIERLTSLVNSTEPSGEATVTLLNLALASMIVDSRTTKLSGLEAAFHECKVAQMNRMAVSIAGRIACYMIDLGQINGAADWMALAEPLTRLSGMGRLSPNFVSARVDLALLEGDFKRARVYIDSLLEYSPRYVTGIVKNIWQINRLRYLQFSSDQPIPREDLELLLKCHALARAFGRHDDHMEVLWSALISYDEKERASSLLFEYLTHSRRERRPAGHFLCMRSASDPVWSVIHRPEHGGYAAL